MLGRLTPEQRSYNSQQANATAKAAGCFDRSDWGARNPEILRKMRLGSNQAMRNRTKDGQWEPEVFLEDLLIRFSVQYHREYPIKTNRIVNAGCGRTRQSTLFLDFYLPDLKVAIELDGVYWHNQPTAIERDAIKDQYCKENNITLIRIPSHKIYKEGVKVVESLKLLAQNHSGQLGISWVKIYQVKQGTVNRPDHVYAKKYDLCLEAEEHSFLCQTVFIHNSKYARIPIVSNRFKGPKQKQINHSANQAVAAMVRNEMKRRGISLGQVEKDSAGNPKLGILHRFSPEMPGPQSQFPTLYSAPRGPDAAALTGLPMHSGIPYSQNTVVTQRIGTEGPEKGKLIREAVTFRTISSKHEAEGRWVMPAKEGLNSLQSARDFVEKQWEEALKAIQSEFSRK